MLLFGNTLCAAQMSAQPKSSFLFYEKLYTYVSPKVSGWDQHKNTFLDLVKFNYMHGTWYFSLF